MSYGTAYERWRGIGPYFAMFPLAFVDSVVEKYTKRGDRILDPFAGRASTVFCGASKGRPSLGIEINPVGWIYGKTKTNPATEQNVRKRLDQIVQLSNDLPRSTGDSLGEFFVLCFSRASLRFLIAARENLDWRDSKIDRTLMTLILIDLHGVRARSFSNQMRQSRAMSPEYCIKWWKQNKQKPPARNPQDFIQKKMTWRYKHGIPELVDSNVWFGDSTVLLGQVEYELRAKRQKRFKLLFTSPPYINVSDYYRDQWLRMWMLGGEPWMNRTGEKNKGPFASQNEYKSMLTKVFDQCAEMMSPSGYVYLRTDARPETFEITREVLAESFPRWRTRVINRPYIKKTQTALYGDKGKKPGEKDIILTGPSV